jgi:hypothetical protein
VTLLAQSAGNYHSLPGTGTLPFGGGVVADPGYEIVRVTLRRPIPCWEGFRLIERRLAAVGRPRTALCAVELRCGKPYTREQFFAPDGFNARYGDLLREWGLVVDNVAYTARTNIAVDLYPLAEQVLFAFSYTVSAADAPATFVVSGAPEASTVRPGETSADALQEKTRDIVTTLDQRLVSLGVGWEQVTAVGLYTVHDLFPILRTELLEKLGVASLNGIQWFYGRPPVENSQIEVDLRGIQSEHRLG